MRRLRKENIIQMLVGKIVIEIFKLAIIIGLFIGFVWCLGWIMELMSKHFIVTIVIVIINLFLVFQEINK